ncbi:MAG TPA: sigma-70 family RNA polymerase sigma factor [Candidatus Krumholzibacteria bacterium]|nr:sigma-70 family RNA polymerase sigma factor [Candidatus Krumholzibacteria bacterium]
MPCAPGNDARDVSAALAGRPGAYQRLVERHAAPVRAAVRRIVHDDDLAADVVQQAFVAAWQHLDAYDPERPFLAWIRRIAVNRALNVVRDRRRLEPLGDLEPPGGGPDPEQQMMQRELQAELAAAVARLPVQQRLLLALRYELNLSGADMAAILAVPAGTVKSRLHAAVARLRSTWARSPGPPSTRPGRCAPVRAAARGGRPPTPPAR